MINNSGMPGPPSQRGSVRPITIEGDQVTYMCEVRTLPGMGLRDGDRCWVEFGGVWAEQGGTRVRVAGQWRECVVLRGQAATGADVHVRVLVVNEGKPELRLEQRLCWCDGGWVCEAHQELPEGHDDCSGAGKQCENPSCPWWQGANPPAMQLEKTN